MVGFSPLNCCRLHSHASCIVSRLSTFGLFVLFLSCPNPCQVLLQLGGESSCQLLSILEARFVLKSADYSSSDIQYNYNAQGTCAIRFDWLRKPKKMSFSSQPSNSNLLFSSFRAIDFIFHSISNVPTVSEVRVLMLYV